MAAKRPQSKSGSTKRTTRKKPPGTKQGHTGDNVVELAVVAGTDVDKVDRPDPPVVLSDEVNARWVAYWDSPLASQAHEADHGALFRWIEAVQEREDLKATIKELGETTEGSTGQLKMNPLYKRLESVEKSIADGEQQFGMTPLARNKLGYAMGQAAMTANEVNKIARQEADRREEAARAEAADETDEIIEAEGFEEYSG